MNRTACLLFLLWLGVLLSASAAPAADMTPESLMSFADHLFGQGDYYRAITEYERVVFHFPDHRLAVTAKFQIALSYFKGEKLEQAIERFRSLAAAYPSDEAGRRSLFMLGEAYYQKKDYTKSRETFGEFLQTYPSDPQADAARIRVGFSYLRQGNWRQATGEFQQLPPGSQLRAEAAELAAEAGKYPDIPKKSPALAGGLSAVLPGSGQLYVDRPGDAAIAFLLNGTFIWATAEAFRHDNNVTGGILLFFEAGWYLGNVYNAVSGAHKYNRRGESAYMDRLEGQYGITYSRGRDGAHVLAFTVRF